MISMIVSFSVDKDRMLATVTCLGFRHVRYGVRPHHIPILGQASGNPSATSSCIGSDAKVKRAA